MPSFLNLSKKLHQLLLLLPGTHVAVQLLVEVRCEQVGGHDSTLPTRQSSSVTSTMLFRQPEKQNRTLKCCQQAGWRAIQCTFLFPGPEVTCLRADVFGAGLTVAALTLQGHALTLSPTILGRRIRAGSVPLSDAAAALGITLRPLCPV